MKNLLYSICVIILLYSCSSEEKPYIDQWMQDAIGSEQIGAIETAYWGDDLIYSMTGIKDGKLCIGLFKDKDYSDPLLVWSAPEIFPSVYEINDGYGDVRKINIHPYRTILYGSDKNNFGGVIVCVGNEPNVIIGEILNYVFFVSEGKYKLVDNPIEHSYSLEVYLHKWYNGSLIFHEKLYTPSGEIFTIPYFSSSTIPLNLHEGINYDLKNISRTNILTGENLWLTSLNEDIEISETNPPRAKLTKIKENGNKWECQMDITYYNGDKETRNFILNIETGEIEKKMM